MKTIIFLLVTVSFLFACSNNDPAPSIASEDQPVVDDLNILANQINGIAADLPQTDLAFLDELADARMVGMGEATHGSKQFFSMKHRIFRYFVERHQFKGVVFEIDVAEAMIFEDYVQGRRDDDIGDLMNKNMYFWVWRTKEVKDMLFWMRAYNASRSEADRIHIYGMDCQLTKYNATKLVSIITKVDAPLAKDIDEHLQLYKVMDTYLDTISSHTISEQIKYVIKTVADNHENLIAAGLPDSDYDNAAHLTNVISQTQQEITDYKLTSDYKVRDKFMAENAQWVLEHLGGQAPKICVWAHNFHVAKDDILQTAGHLLKEKLQHDYRSIGFGFAKGGFNAVSDGTLKVNTISTDPLDGSVNHFFTLATRKMFSLNMSKVTNEYPSLLNIISTSRGFISIGSGFDHKPEDYYYPTTLGNYFDVVVYFDQVEAAERY